MRRKRAGKCRKRMKSERIRLKCINNGFWDCRSAKQRGAKLERLLYKSDILLLQETQTHVLNYPGYICYASPMSQTHHGQTVLIRKDFPHSVLDLREWKNDNIELKVAAHGVLLISVSVKTP